MAGMSLEESLQGLVGIAEDPVPNEEGGIDVLPGSYTSLIVPMALDYARRFKELIRKENGVVLDGDPSVTIGPDMSIDLYWRKGAEYDILFNIKASGETANYHGVFNDDNDHFIKGKLTKN